MWSSEPCQPFRLLDLPYPAAQHVMDLMTPRELIMMSIAGDELANFTQFYIRENKEGITLYFDNSLNDYELNIVFCVANGSRMSWQLYNQDHRAFDDMKTYKFGDSELETKFFFNDSLFSYLPEDLRGVIQLVKWLQTTLKFEIDWISFYGEVETWWPLLLRSSLILETKDLTFSDYDPSEHNERIILQVLKERAIAGKKSETSNVHFTFAPFVQSKDIRYLLGQTIKIDLSYLRVADLYEIVTHNLENKNDTESITIQTKHWSMRDYNELKWLLDLKPLDEDEWVNYETDEGDLRATDEFFWTGPTIRIDGKVHKEKAVKYRIDRFAESHISVFNLYEREIEVEENVGAVEEIGQEVGENEE